MQNKRIEEALKRGSELASKFLAFNSTSLSPYTAVQTAEKKLMGLKFQKLQEDKAWDLQAGGRYYIKRGLSSLLAFAVPENFGEKSIFKMIGTHVDSPCVRLAPVFEHKSNGFQQVCLQMYGGGIWHTWYDRALGLAGRVVIKGKEGGLVSRVYSSSKAIAKICSVAIHLKDSNPLDIKKESDLKPIIATELLKQIHCEGGNCSALLTFLAAELNVEPSSIVDFDLCFADWEQGRVFGLYDEFLSAPRLDNLYSVFCSLEAMTDSLPNPTPDCTVLAMFDHEEIGSETYVGANSEFLKTTLTRLCEALKLKPTPIIRKSFFLSCDMAHSVHPNFSSLHQSNHQPKVNSGVVLKRNCNGRYTTDALSGATIKLLAEREDIPLQEFIVSCDSRCGSTIGPMVASKLGCLSVDIGAPQLGMHSISETAGILDLWYYSQFMKAFFNAELQEMYPKEQFIQF